MMLYKKSLIVVLITSILVILKTTCGQTCSQATGCPPPEITSRSCLDYSRKGFKDNGYYKIYNFQTNTYLTVYCDFTSEPGAAWTLIESFALKNNNLDSFRKHPFSTNAPVNDKTPNWNLYRMSFSQMKFLRSQSTHWSSGVANSIIGGAHIHIFKFTDHEYNRFQTKLTVQNMNI